MNIKGRCRKRCDILGVIWKGDIPTGAGFCKIRSLVGVPGMNEFKREVFTRRVDFEIGIGQIQSPSRYGIYIDQKRCLSDAVPVYEMFKGDVHHRSCPCIVRHIDGEVDVDRAVDFNRRRFNRACGPRRSILVKGVDLQEGIKRQFIGCITQIREIESEGQHITRLARRFRPVGGYNRPFMAGSSLNRDRDGVKHTFTTQRGPGKYDVKRRKGRNLFGQHDIYRANTC